MARVIDITVVVRDAFGGASVPGFAQIAIHEVKNASRVLRVRKF